jgi:hypothetical protein
MDMGRIENVCKVGKGKECCRYLIASSLGIECAKPNVYLKRIIDTKVEKGEMVAIGDNCEGYEGD